MISLSRIHFLHHLNKFKFTSWINYGVSWEKTWEIHQHKQSAKSSYRNQSWWLDYVVAKHELHSSNAAKWN